MAKEYGPSEKRETPEMESRNHPPAFLKKAERLAERKKGKRAGERKASR